MRTFLLGTLVAIGTGSEQPGFQEGDCTMGLPNKDEIKGKFDQAKGEAKETVGRALDDRELENEGRGDQAGGEIREGFGTARRKVGEAIEDLGESVRK
jgi:uncharacterized protein YjbJ (UPF0337 family)